MEEFLPDSKKKKKKYSKNLPIDNWEEVQGKITTHLNPKQIRFTHESISNKFGNGNRLSLTIEEIKKGNLRIEDFPPIRVVFFRQLFWSLDNRRLYVFKEVAVSSIPVILVDGKDKSFWRKLTSTDYGKKNYIGKDAFSQRMECNISYPIEYGNITNFDDLTEIYSHIIYDKLKIAPEERVFITSEPPFSPRANRERLMEILFEEFGVSGFYTEMSGILAKYSSGRTTSIIVDLGETVSYTYPIYEGHQILGGIQRLDYSGRDITNYLMQQLNQKGNHFHSNSDRETVREIKEKFSIVAKSEDDFKKSTQSGEYLLPDGSKIQIENEVMYCYEGLFNPSLFGLPHSLPLHQAIYQSIMACDMDTRRDFLYNIVLVGGTSLAQNLLERLNNEFYRIKPKEPRTHIFNIKEKKSAVWIGGSILGSLSTFVSLIVTKDRYEECGHKYPYFRLF